MQATIAQTFQQATCVRGAPSNVARNTCSGLPAALPAQRLWPARHTHRHTVSSSLFVARPCRLARRTGRMDRRQAVVVRAQQQEQQLSRREAGLAAVAALAAFAAPRPAYALFGFGEKEAAERYDRDTVRGKACSLALGSGQLMRQQDRLSPLLKYCSTRTQHARPSACPPSLCLCWPCRPP